MFDLSVNDTVNLPYKYSGFYGPYMHYPIEERMQRPDVLYGYILLENIINVCRQNPDNLLEDIINVCRQNPDQYTWKITNIGRNEYGMFINVRSRVGEEQLTLRLRKRDLGMIGIDEDRFSKPMNVRGVINYLNVKLPIVENNRNILDEKIEFSGM